MVVDNYFRRQLILLRLVYWLYVQSYYVYILSYNYYTILYCTILSYTYLYICLLGPSTAHQDLSSTKRGFILNSTYQPIGASVSYICTYYYTYITIHTIIIHTIPIPILHACYNQYYLITIPLYAYAYTHMYTCTYIAYDAAAVSTMLHMLLETRVGGADTHW